MMPEWLQLDSSCTMSEQQESVKKKNLKIKFQVILVFYRTNIQAETCADLESCVRGGLTLTTIFDEGREDQNTTISGPSSARQRNAN